MSEKKFASQADLEEKRVSFDKLSDHAYAYTAEGDPNTGIVVGDEAALVFEKRLTLWLGKLQVEIMQLGRGHTKGDTVVWLPQEKILFSGDLVEYGATPYTGDAYLSEWPATLDAIAALQPGKLVPGRGASLMNPKDVKAGLDGTRAFITEMFAAVKSAAASGKDLRSTYKETYAALKPKFGEWVIFDHCLPFDVSRGYYEATRFREPRVWTAQRDKEMWESLEG